MINNSKLKQYWEVYEFVKSSEYCSKEEILEHLNKKTKKKVSDSTFERIKKGLKELGIKLIHHKRKGYTLQELEPDVLQEFKLIRQAANMVSVESATPKELKKMLEYVHISKNAFEGNENLEFLIQCCVDLKEIQFTHFHILRNELSQKIVQPYQVREHEGRWYLVGLEQSDEEVGLKSYGIDRISNLVTTGRYFKRDTKYDPTSMYRDVIGVFPDKNKTAEVIHLKIESKSWKYINALKWHPSQEFLGEENEFVEFQLFVQPSRELEMKILQWASRIRVVSPISLRKKIKAMLEEGLAMNS